MPEIKKRKVVIASVLKPVNDVRMAEKLGLSLLSNGFEVHVVGFPGSGEQVNGLISHTLPQFTRLSLRRIFVRLKILRMTIAIGPSVLIITTHELLGISILVRILSGTRVIYDVQENYYRNIRYTQVFPPLLRTVLAIAVRAKEYVVSPFVSHFFLAEKAYAKEFSFHRRRYTILENKVRKIDSTFPYTRDLRKLLFSGTLSASTGVFKAIELAILLHALDQKISLTIIGYCPQKQTSRKIRALISEHPFIRLIGGDDLVPHQRITQEIFASGAGIIAYPHNPATDNSIPTKLYEYLGCRLPILLPYQGTWWTICKPYNAAVLFGWNSIDARRILDALFSQQFYTSIPEDVFWDSEESKLLKVVNAMMKS